jgi:transcriptional regulator with XRE-family HTH domain
MPKSIHRFEYELLRSMLRSRRLAAGMSQLELSKGLGRSQSFVSDIERGVRRIDLIELRDVCALVGTTAVEFLQALEETIQTGQRGFARKLENRRGSFGSPVRAKQRRRV